MEYTDNLHLNKPSASDVIDISKLNENVDILDESIAQLSGTMTSALQRSVTFTFTIPVEDWVESGQEDTFGGWTAAVFNAAITDGIPEVLLDTDSLETAFSCGLMNFAITRIGSLRFYAMEKPDAAISGSFRLIDASQAVLPQGTTTWGGMFGGVTE